MKTLENKMKEVTKQYGITLKNTLVTYGIIILYCNTLSDLTKLTDVLSKLKSEIVTNENDLTIGIIF